MSKFFIIIGSQFREEGLDYDDVRQYISLEYKQVKSDQQTDRIIEEYNKHHIINCDFDVGKIAKHLKKSTNRTYCPNPNIAKNFYF